MTDYLDLAEARYALLRSVNESVGAQFKVLLEEKHLYQNVVAIDFPEVYRKLSERIIIETDRYAFQKFANELYEEPMIPSETPILTAIRGAENQQFPKMLLFLQNVKLYCSVHKSREAFSPTWYVDATNEIRLRHHDDHRIALHPRRYQLFALVYQCETCKSGPVSFLIERQDWKLTIAGRSPFEEVEVPKYIPKPEKWLFSEAIVAAQTGNTLAGLFYLRCFIEQFARRQTGIRDKQTGETILGAYQAILPEKQRDFMPSLKSWYDKLSAAIHAAQQSAALFEEALAAISEHFDFRRLYKIPEVETPPAEDATKPMPAGEVKK